MAHLGEQANSEIIADDGNDSALGDNYDGATTSLASSILEDLFEHGRRYHRFREGRYVFPNDHPEREHEA
jgi:hypothetical protein